MTTDPTASTPVPHGVALRDPVRAATLRLAATRAQLHAAMRPAPHRSFASARAAQGAQGIDPGAWLSAIREYLSQWALPRAVFAAVGEAWADHPLREGGQAAWQEAERTLAPLVRRHPVAAVSVAAGAGALLLVLRPWRWLAGPLKALPRDASRWVSAQLSQPAVQTAIAGFVMSQLARHRRPQPGPAAAHPPSP